MNVSKSFAVLGALIAVAGVAGLTSGTASATNAAACVDGTKRSNLSVTWNAADSVTVKTIDGKTLCADTNVLFSSYTMADNYNGKGFSESNTTSWPQTVFATKAAVLKKGTTGVTTLKVELPEACKNIQVDLYYPPEIKIVTKEGHGAQYITGKIFEKTVKECVPPAPEKPEEPVKEPETPVVPVPEAQTPETPAPQVIVPAAAVPVELPHTGSNVVVPVVASAIAAVSAYAIAYAASKRQ